MRKYFIPRAIVVLLFVMLIGLSSQAFSRQFQASLGNALSKTNLGAKDASQLFAKGKAANIYTTSLTLLRDNAMKSSFASIDAIMAAYPEFSSCNITADDVLNVLYVSNAGFRSMLELTVINKNKSKKKISVPSNSDIVASYKRFLLCRKGQLDFVDISDSKDVSNLLNNAYGEPMDTNFFQETLKQMNFGDDMYHNATLDDSDYDLLIDIAKIQQKFFESFTYPTQTLFYGLPTVSSIVGGGGNGSGPGSSPGGDFTVGTGVPNSGSTSVPPPPGSLGVPGDIFTSPGQDDFLATLDPRVRDFIDENNTQLYPPSNLYDLPASQCVSGVTTDLSYSCFSGHHLEDLVCVPNRRSCDILHGIGLQDYSQGSWGDCVPAQCDYGYYISGLQCLLSQLSVIDPPVTVPVLISPPNGMSGSTGTNPVIYPSGTSNEWVEEAVDDIGGACGQTCNGLPDGEQLSCLSTCILQCTATCEGLPAYDKLYCESQCLCITVGGPIGEKWKGMENMYKIKFCTIPVQNGRVSGGKKVFSIEEIFKEIKKVFDSLLNGGEIIKRTKAKEYFDTSLSEIKFQDFFSFQIVTQVKPLFANISKSAQAMALKNTNTNYENTILGVTPDDQNKYIVVARVSENKISAGHIDDLADFQSKVKAIEERDAQSKSVIKDVLLNASDQSTSNLNQEVMNFLISNENFWAVASQNLIEINGLANLIKINTEAGKKVKK